MRLCHKAWLESRVRFLVSAAVLSLYCVSFVSEARVGFPPVFDRDLPYTAFVWRGIYNGIDVPVFVGLAMLLGLGGLQRERVNGTALFTLALPVSRSALLLARASVAAAEVATLAAIPAVIVPWMSARIGHAYPAGHALRFALLFGATGAVWMSVGLLWSALISSEASGATICVATPVAYALLIGFTRLREWPRANIFNLMNGARLGWLDGHTALFRGSTPWTAVGLLIVAALTFVAGAAAVSAREDF